MATTYIGVGNKSKKIKNFYIGVGNQAKKVKKAYIGVNGKAKLFYSSSLLPDEYQQVEYIQNRNSYQYIILPFELDSNINLIFDMDIVENSNPHVEIGNSRETDYNIITSYYISINPSSGVDVYFNKSNKDSIKRDIGYQPGNIGTQRHIWNFNSPGGYFYMDDKLLGQSSNVFDFGLSKYNFSLFRAYDYSLGYSYTQYKLRHFQARNNQSNTLLYDIYPCYKKYDGTIGVYDLIGNTFYENAYTSSNSGFYKGDDI